MPPEIDDEIVVAIPDDTVQVGDEGTVVAPEKTEERPKRERSDGGRFKGAEKSEDDRYARLERERDEQARVAADVQARLAEAEAAARDATEARGQAEETARIRESQAMRAHWAAIHSDKSQIESAISATQIEAAAAERDYISASEAGDLAKQAKAQRDMAKAEAALIQLNQGKAAADLKIEETQRLFEEHARAAKEKAAEVKPEPKKADPQPPRQITPDEWIDTTAKSAIGETGADWLRENKHFVTDPRQNAIFLKFADLYAAKHGAHALKDEDFIDALNDEFLPDRVEREEEREREPPKQQRPRATVSAPVSRSKDQFFSSRNMNATQVKLPPRLAAFVKASGLDPTQYALQAVADIKAGNLPKNYLDPDYDHGV